MLVKGLPPDSAFHRRGRLWTQENELQALAIDRIEMWSQVLVARWSSKQSDVPKAIGVVHPDRPEAPKKKPASLSDVARMFR